VAQYASDPAAGADPTALPLRPLGRGTLSRRLIIRVAALVAALTIILDACSIVIAYRVTRDGLDQQLLTAMRGQSMLMTAQGAGSWRATDGFEILITGRFLSQAVFVDGQPHDALTAGQLAPLTAVSSSQVATISGAPVYIGSVTIPGLGQYRVVRQIAPGFQHIIGLPLEQVTSVIARLIAIEIIITAGVVILSAFAVAGVVRLTLRPLTHLARTASTVAHTPLDRGEVQLPARVAPEAADPASEIGRVGLALNTMLDNVQYALDARQRSETQVRQFVADASHELRNPLAAIRGYAELTRRHDADALPPDAAFALGRIDAESQRMSKLVENLLLLARLDNGQRPDFAPVDVSEVVVNAVSDAQVTGPDHTWTLEVPDEPLMVWADPNQLHQVVVNLLGNARKHTPAGTLVETTAAPTPYGDQVVITVTDHGPGIEAHLVDHVFERFARADVARTHDDEGSTGLGLAIVAAVIAAHGGQASVDSRPGHTRFTVSVPTYRPDIPGHGAGGPAPH